MSERRAADERFRRVVEAAPNAMLLVDMDGRITLANRQAEAMFGCESSALLGRAVDDFAAGVPASTHAAHRRQFGDQPEARRMGAGRELHARRADGSEFVVEVGLSPIMTREGPQVLASIVDVTVRRQDGARIAAPARAVVQRGPDQPGRAAGLDPGARDQPAAGRDPAQRRGRRA